MLGFGERRNGDEVLATKAASEPTCPCSTSPCLGKMAGRPRAKKIPQLSLRIAHKQLEQTFESCGIEAPSPSG